MKAKVTLNRNRKPTLKLRRILVPIDFSGISRHALRFAVPLAMEFKAKIILLHVIVPPPYPTEMGMLVPVEPTAEKTIEAELTELSHRQIPIRLRGKALVRTGQPYTEITRTASKIKADLIVLTTHGHSGLKRVLLGSTAERVLRHAPCPVLSVPKT